MMCDFGTGNNNKLNWVLEDKQELIDIIETIYRGAKKGRGLVVSPKGKFVQVRIENNNADFIRLLYQIPLLDN
jgi:Mitosis protein DIM1